MFFPLIVLFLAILWSRFYDFTWLWWSDEIKGNAAYFFYSNFGFLILVIRFQRAIEWMETFVIPLSRSFLLIAKLSKKEPLEKNRELFVSLILNPNRIKIYGRWTDCRHHNGKQNIQSFKFEHFRVTSHATRANFLLFVV